MVVAPIDSGDLSVAKHAHEMALTVSWCGPAISGVASLGIKRAGRTARC